MFLTVVLWAGLVLPAFAQNPLGLPENLDYDVYVSNPGGEPLIIQTVQIVAVRKVYDELFLVVHLDKFDAAHSEGVVKYGDILAVLPSHRTTVYKKSGGYKTP